MSQEIGLPELGETLPVAVIAHHVPGRCRLRVQSRKGNSHYFARAAAQLRNVSCVTGVRTSALTGSIVVDYSGPFEQIAWIGRRHGLFMLKRARARGHVATIEDVQAIQRQWAARGPFSSSPIENFRTAVLASNLQRPWLALTLGGLGAYQLSRADPIASALNILFMIIEAAFTPGNATPTDPDVPLLASV